MPRVLHYRNYGVFVHDEHGAPHHRAHAHVKFRATRVASVYLETLEPFDELEPVPAALWDLIRSAQDELLDEWERLNT